MNYYPPEPSIINRPVGIDLEYRSGTRERIAPTPLEEEKLLYPSLVRRKIIVEQLG